VPCDAPCSLRTERLRLPPDVDPEKGTYDDYAIEATSVTAGTTGLASAASVPASLFRRLWETSKLALSLFSVQQLLRPLMLHEQPR